MSSRGIFKGLVAAAAISAAVPAIAHEPDGRVAIRYDWPETKSSIGEPPKLRITLTAIVDLRELSLSAKLPPGVGLAMHAAGSVAAIPWPESGVTIGDLPAGRSVVVELDVEKPPTGGGIVGFALRGTAGGREVVEGVGVPVGTPGVEPVLRNGALEFPAEQGAPTP